MIDRPTVICVYNRNSPQKVLSSNRVKEGHCIPISRENYIYLRKIVT